MNRFTASLNGPRGTLAASIAGSVTLGALVAAVGLMACPMAASPLALASQADFLSSIHAAAGGIQDIERTRSLVEAILYTATGYIVPVLMGVYTTGRCIKKALAAFRVATASI